jgi:hypothetical protein
MPRSTPTETASGFKALEEATIAIEAESDAAADVVADAAIEVSATAADAVDGMVNKARTVADIDADAACELGSEISDRFAAAADRGQSAVERAGRRISSLPQSSSFLAEFVQLAKETVELQRSAISRLSACRSPDQLASLQLELTRETVAGVADATKRLSQASLRDFAQITSPTSIAA